MKVALYCRVSTDEQREKESIETQVEKLRRYCEREQLEVWAWYLDDGISGDRPMERRPHAARLLTDARAGCFEKVLATRYDRIGRGKPSQTLQDIEQIEDLGIPVECIEQWVDTSDPNGIIMRLVHIGVARTEWLTTSKRSQEATERLALTGQWLGGIVPYGYRVDGYQRAARIVPSDDPLAGVGMSEADVVRLIYRKLADERRSCVWLADHLNALGVPPSYARDGREVLRNKRKAITSALWRPSRIRNMVVNATYKGEHHYGKRSSKVREVIVRQVPALVAPDVWERAQAQLRANMLCPVNTARRQYLLRGLMRCGCCGLTYVGTGYTVADGREKRYYLCSGRQNYRGIFGLQGARCPSAPVSARIEDDIWGDVEGFLRNPGQVLEQLEGERGGQAGHVQDARAEIARLTAALDGKQGEKDAVLGLYRRGRISDTDLDRQLDEIEGEGEQLRAEVRRLQGKAQEAQGAAARLRSAEQLLRELNRRLDEPLTWELKRQLIEALVERVVVATVEGAKKKRAEVTVHYRFENTVVPTFTGTGSWQLPA